MKLLTQYFTLYLSTSLAAVFDFFLHLYIITPFSLMPAQIMIFQGCDIIVVTMTLKCKDGPGVISDYPDPKHYGYSQNFQLATGCKNAFGSLHLIRSLLLPAYCCLKELSLSFILMFGFPISKEGSRIYKTYFHLKFPVLSNRQDNSPVYLIVI